jgi:tripartite ATP-independent transporter DctP family solute receptor
MKGRLITLLLVAVALVAGSGCRAEDDQTVIKLGHGMDISHPVHRAMVFMAERVAEKSDGQMRIDIYPSEQLGTERQCLELLQIGSLDLTKVSSSVMESFSPLYKVFGLPYVFEDDAHRFAVLEGSIGRRILLSSEPAWLRGITYYDAGSRSFYTVDRPIRTPEDLEGLKIRTQESPVAISMVNELGGAATPISFGELYTALQQGVVDGAENNPPSFHTTRHYELCDYYSLDRHTSPPDVLLGSTHLWERLTEQERQWLQEAANESAQHQKKLWAEATEEAMKTVKEAGVEIIEPDIDAFVEAVQPLYEQYRREQPEVYGVFQEIRNMVQHAEASADTTDAAATAN